MIVATLNVRALQLAGHEAKIRSIEGSHSYWDGVSLGCRSCCRDHSECSDKNDFESLRKGNVVQGSARVCPEMADSQQAYIWEISLKIRYLRGRQSINNFGRRRLSLDGGDRRTRRSTGRRATEAGVGMTRACFAAPIFQPSNSSFSSPVLSPWAVTPYLQTMKLC